MTTPLTLYLGEIVSWSVPSEVTLAQVRAALVAAGFDANLARDMMPRNAFSRAATQLKEGRIIEPVNETPAELFFQLNQKVKNSAGEMEYPKECVLTLNKSTGDVTGTDPAVATAAKNELDRQIGIRKASDMTRLVQKLFDTKKGELVSIRPAGGAYFVPALHTTLIDQVQQFLGDVGGDIRRFSIQDPGTGTTAGSIASSMTDHFNGLLAELRDAVKGVDMSAPAIVIKRRTDEIQILKAKIDTYKDLLQQNAKTIKDELATTERDYLIAVGIISPEEAAKTAPAAEPAPEEAPATPDPMADLAELEAMVAAQ